ncbi:lactococcin 972 family bacteriocin [Staphylococcus rostri]|uniref:Lactococcin 972 family bacteriocin n=1 Tax=Staphylococcus rostri TaxID=522262 RepID=A0A2K3YRT0_9STAP|nr:hypothetical protein [Staphylococcus rostri]PNZ28297.1 hypothetical protein CD122_04875 [Staphylococcus rostri]
MKKHVIAASAVAIGLSGLTIGGIANADVTSINGGSENVDNYNGLVRSEVLDQPSTQDGTALRKITQGKKAGGYWIRGTKGGYTISSYKHYTKSAQAYLVNGRGNVVSGGWKKPGVFSTAKIKGKATAHYTHS